jgi:hypothetical protein
MTTTAMPRSISQRLKRSGCASRGSWRRSSAGTRKLAPRSLAAPILHQGSPRQATPPLQEPLMAVKGREVEREVAAVDNAVKTSRTPNDRIRQAAASSPRASLERENCTIPTTLQNLALASRSAGVKAAALLDRHRRLRGTGKRTKSFVHREDRTAVDEEASALLGGVDPKRTEFIARSGSDLSQLYIQQTTSTTTRHQSCRPAGPPSQYPSSYPSRHR